MAAQESAVKSFRACHDKENQTEFENPKYIYFIFIKKENDAFCYSLWMDWLE